MKIVGFTQLRNELEKGNLENWFKCMQQVCDYIYIFDQNSTDGSIEYYKKFENVVAVLSPTNRFEEENVCKNELLNLVKKDHPDTDWIFWTDGDELVDGRLLKDDAFRSLCNHLDVNYPEQNGVTFGYKNLWRSDIYFRKDNDYNALNGCGRCCLWRFSQDLHFEEQKGLHLAPYPKGIKSFVRVESYFIIHRGFSTDKQITDKYRIYKNKGLKGYVERLLDETTLDVEPLECGLLPDWFEIKDDVHPSQKEKIRKIYNKEYIKKSLEIVALIYKSTDYLELIVNELKKDYCKIDGWDIGIRIVANDATEEVIQKLKDLDINYTIYNDKKPGDYYLNRVYRCWNFAVESSEYNSVCLVNSDMVFSKDWLKNLLKYHNGLTIPCSKLIESGKMPSGAHGIGVNFGRNPKEIDFDGWYKYVESESKDEAYLKGLFMPCIFHKEKFMESGGYPEGNIYQDGKAGSLNGRVTITGDAYYFYEVLEKQFGMKHITVYDSLIYHIQEGEKDG